LIGAVQEETNIAMHQQRVVITGAAGGLGRACARLFGASHDLVLTDVAEPVLRQLETELAAEGYIVAGSHAGDLGDDRLLTRLAGELMPDDAFTLIHTAGLSPTLADWKSIIEVNLVATERLLRNLEPQLQPGTVAILVASAAAHSAPVIPEIDQLLADPLADGLIDRFGTALTGMLGPDSPMLGGLAYAFSKRAVLRICERRAAAWGQKGARILSISPGVIATPMGKREMEKDPMVVAMAESAPAGRTGRAVDIAFAARFLASAEASFITGCDLRVDGGSIAVARGA
jgi:NAD(P)-dependent dehydrogenase (short-subunit alcohol dehydrogenase family)